MQIDLFDLITDETGQNFCEICKQPSEADCCSTECAEIWINKYLNFENEEQIDKLD